MPEKKSQLADGTLRQIFVSEKAVGPNREEAGGGIHHRLRPCINDLEYVSYVRIEREDERGFKNFTSFPLGWSEDEVFSMYDRKNKKPRRIDG